jgi:TPR repeat protein
VTKSPRRVNRRRRQTSSLGCVFEKQWPPRDGKEAAMQINTARLLLLAAENGDAAAQFNLAVLCESRLDDNGYPTEADRTTAMKWLLAAAEQVCRVFRVNLPRCMLTALLLR